MNQENRAIRIGNVLRADIRGFVAASRIPEPEVPTFGTFVHAPIQQGQRQLTGLVYDISMQDDQFLRHLAVTLEEDNPAHQEMIADQRERAIPVEISVVAIGYRDSHGYHYGLPPQPPMVLKRITVCRAEEVKEITARPEWMRSLLENREVPTDELIARAIQRSAKLHAEEQQTYLITTGRYLARQLVREPLRLETLLRRMAGGE
ncbi:MAG TPA: hypothetical protein G4N98_05835 [Thermoflexia bacterium]|nr:hypothetical protein [Thermoflexia bacterium]